MRRWHSMGIRSVLLMLASALSINYVAAQTLTISTGTSSGTGWSFNATTRTLTVTANSTVNLTTFQNYFTAGNVIVVGNTTTFNVTVSNAVTSSTSGSALSIGAAGNTGTITFTAGVSINGAVNVIGGAVALNAASSITTTNTSSGDISINAATVAGTGNIVVAGGRTATVSVSSASTYAGVISGTSSAFTKSGIGKLTITKTQTYTGATSISAGTLELYIGSLGGNINSASAVEIQASGTLLFNTRRILDFPNAISGTGVIAFAETDSLRVSGNLTSSAVIIESNSNVLDVLQRITVAEQFGLATNATGGIFPAGANYKRFDPVANVGHIQFQQRDLGNDFKTVTVFALLEQSGANVTIKVNTSIFGTGAAERPKQGASTYHLGIDNSTTGSALSLATSNTSAGAGVRKIEMSGMVYLTGSITFTGTIQTQASNLSQNDGNNAYSRKRIGAFGMTGSTLPAIISNAGYFSINASNALTLSGALSSDGTTAQIGEPVTLTGVNTFSGYTVIASGKTLNVGAGATTGAIQGNIENYGILTFDRSDAVSYTGVISGSGSLIKSGAGTLTMTGANTYSGSTSINAGTLVIQRNAPSTGSSGFSGAGTLVIEPSSASFTSAVNYPITGFTVSSSIGGLTVGKLGNTANITVNSDVTAAGPLTLYGGTVTLGGNLSTSTLHDVSIYSSNPLAISGSRAITTTGMFNYMPTSTSFASAISYPVSNLTVSSNGLQLGKPGNTAAMTITGAASSNGPVTVHTGAFTTDATATLTATGSALTVNASGNVTLNAALAGSSTTVNVQGNLQTTGSLTNVNLEGGNAQDITGSATLTNLTVNKSAGIATMTAGRQNLTGTLNLTAGTLAAGGYLTLKSNATGTARVAQHLTGTGIVTGNVMVERFIPAVVSSTARLKQWRMLGFPYSSNLQLSNITGIGISFTPQTMMVYSENGDDGIRYGSGGPRNPGYQPFSNTTESIAPGKGLAAWIYGDNTATAGTGMLSGDLTISSIGSLNETGADIVMSGMSNTVQGWHLIGNPFASSIDWDVISPLSPTIAYTIYRWDPQAENWTTYNSDTKFALGSGSRYIESGAAFFIKAATPLAGDLTLNIPQSAKVTNAPDLHFSKNPLKLDIPGQRVGGASTLAGLRLKASGMGNPIPGEAYLDVSKTDATKGWDPQYDGLMMARSSGASVYFDGEKDNDYSMHFDAPLMNGEQRYYPITVTTPKAGETLIEVTPEGKWSSMHSVALIDKQLGRTILMRDGQLSYKLRLEELKSEGRFLLAINHVKLSTDGQSPVFEAKALGNPVTNNIIDLQLTHPTAAPKRWRVVDAMGREAGMGAFATDAGIQHRLTVPGMRSSGVYVLQVEMDNGETQQVRILKN